MYIGLRRNCSEFKWVTNECRLKIAELNHINKISDFEFSVFLKICKQSGLLKNAIYVISYPMKCLFRITVNNIKFS